MDFKGKAKAFVRTYGFLASILPYSIAEWEKLSIFLNFLIPKLPAPKEEDLSKGILETIDMDSYRVEVQAAMKIALPDEDAEIGPVPTSGRRTHAGAGTGSPVQHPQGLQRAVWQHRLEGRRQDPEGDREEIPAKVAADRAYQNAIKNSDKQNARIEHDKALQRVIIELLTDHTELFKQFSDNPAFKKWLSDSNFAATYHAQAE